MTEGLVFTILGGGNGGFCTAGDLALRGHEVRLYESPTFADTLEPIIRAGGISMRGVAGEGFARPALVTTEIEAALEGADIILAVVPAMGHKLLARACAPHLKAGQILVLIPGCFGGALEYNQEHIAHGGSPDIILAETTTFMYAAKKEGGNKVWARGLKKYLPLAALPAHRTAEVVACLKSVYPQIVPASNVLDTSFHNLNHIVHPVAMVLNLGFIESCRIENWYFYPDGYSQSVGRVGDQLDLERLAILDAFGIEGVSAVETLHRFYGHQGMDGENLYELFSNSPVHKPARGPKSTDNRLLTEDIPYGLVPMASFAHLVDVPTPLMDAIITLSSTINEEDYRQTGRSLESLGLSGKTPDEIISYVNGIG